MVDSWNLIHREIILLKILACFPFLVSRDDKIRNTFDSLKNETLSARFVSFNWSTMDGANQPIAFSLMKRVDPDFSPRCNQSSREASLDEKD